MGKEKRKALRLKTRLQVDCKLKDQTEPIQASCIEISKGGTSLSLPEELPKGKDVELEICLPSGSKICTHGEVVWTKGTTADKEAIVTGIKFTKMDTWNTQKIMGYIGAVAGVI